MLGRQSRWRALLLICGILISSHGWSDESRPSIHLQNITIHLEDGWTIVQKGKERNHLVLGVRNQEDEYVTVTVTHDDGKKLEDIFHLGKNFEVTVKEVDTLSFKLVSLPVTTDDEVSHTKGFFLIKDNFRYVGYTNSENAEMASHVLNQFVSMIQRKEG